MLTPKKVKYRKPHRISYDGSPKRGTKVSFGTIGIQALEGNYVNSRQIEATRVAITRYLKRQGKLHIRIFPHLPITKKPLEVRMGKGKGNVEYYAAVVKRGMILFELDGVSEEDAREALRLGQHKLPLKSTIVLKGEEKNV